MHGDELAEFGLVCDFDGGEGQGRLAQQQPQPPQGTDVGEDEHHIYRVTVPPGNAGLLSTDLLALSGNPQLYIRRSWVHGLGAAADYEDWVNSGSSYGQWVPGPEPEVGYELTPGEYWVAVRGEGSNVRYRLTLSLGDIEDLAQDGAA